MLTLSIIKADTGGFVGHSSVHPAMIDEARERLERAKGSLIVDGQVATCGDDLSLILTHTHGAEDERIHRFAFDLFMATTDIAVDLGLYGAGQDLLSDAFSGNLRASGRATPSRPSASGCRSRCCASWPTRPSRAPGTCRCSACSPIRSPRPGW
jgi:fructose 1,6-bisphosphatase